LFSIHSKMSGNQVSFTVRIQSSTSVRGGTGDSSHCMRTGGVPFLVHFSQNRIPMGKNTYNVSVTRPLSSDSDCTASLPPPARSLAHSHASLYLSHPFNRLIRHSLPFLAPKVSLFLLLRQVIFEHQPLNYFNLKRGGLSLCFDCGGLT
jgi:hypothetical protein